MKTREVQNIYLEHFIPNSNKQDVWNKVINTPLFQSLFTEPTFVFLTNQKGKLSWKRLFVIDIEADYLVESYEPAMHLLLQINHHDFSSLLLLVVEEDKNGVLLRLDHRSFSGICKKIHYKSFDKRWKKLARSFTEKK